VNNQGKTAMIHETILRGGAPGPWELILILLIVLLVFGAGKLPQIGDALGRGIKNFKSATSGKPDAPVDVTPNAPAVPAVPAVIEDKDGKPVKTVEVETKEKQGA